MPERSAAQAALVDDLTRRFPEVPAEVVLRQVLDAEGSVDFFGVGEDERVLLVARLAGSHVESLAQLARQRSGG